MTDNTQNHWAAQPERGSRLFLSLTTLMVRYLPAFLMRPCIWFVVLYFYATAPKTAPPYPAGIKPVFSGLSRYRFAETRRIQTIYRVRRGNMRPFCRVAAQNPL